MWELPLTSYIPFSVYFLKNKQKKEEKSRTKNLSNEDVTFDSTKLIKMGER